MTETNGKKKIYFFGGRDVFWVLGAYRKLIRTLYKSWTIVIQGVYNTLCMKAVESEEKRY
ncbi:hypothetical protein RCZ04_21460 [Capnocytophaga sp. HP1101]